MKIIALPDLHAQTGSLEAIGACLSSVDLILLVGDLTNGGGVMETGVVVTTVRKFNSNILAVPGNWDHPEVTRILLKKEST